MPWLSEDDAVRLVLDWTSEDQIETVDPDSTGPDGRAFRFLRRNARQIQARGWQSNTFLARTLTANSSGEIIAGTTAGFGDDADGVEVLWVRGGGRDHWRNLMLIGDRLFDDAQNTDDFGDGGTVDVDVVLGYTDWDDIQPQSLRYLIAYWTAWDLQSNSVGSQPKLVSLSEKIKELELTVPRPPLYRNAQPINPLPLFPGADPTQQDNA